MTLIEILVVLAIIGLIVGATAVAAHRHLVEAQITTTYQATRKLRGQVEVYQLSHAGRCPESLEKLHAQELLAEPPVDAWGTAYILECREGKAAPRVSSAGPDREPGNDDDIRSWEKPKREDD